MAATKIRDVVAKIGEYDDRNTGQKKGRYLNVGALMKNEDGSVFIILNRWFNPGGVPSDRDTIILNCFDPNREQVQQQAPAAGGGVDDEIPF